MGKKHITSRLVMIIVWHDVSRPAYTRSLGRDNQRLTSPRSFRETVLRACQSYA